MSRRIQYLEFLEKGGDINKLPAPVAPEDEFLYNACLYGLGLEKKPQGFYRCILNSGGSAQNFFGGFYDLGEGRKVTSVKVRFRFTLRNVVGTTEIPAKIGVRLFANNQKGKSKVDVRDGNTTPEADYWAHQNLYETANVQENKEYIAEHTFGATGNHKNLSDFRYLKVFVTLDKTTQVLTTKHAVDVHEISLEIDGVLYDITDTIYDFGAQAESKITYVRTDMPLSAVARRRAPWFGKTVVGFGDSITWGYTPGVQTPTQLGNTWVEQLKDYCGFLNARNNGISSSTVAEKSTDVTNWDRDRNPMTKRVASLDANADVVIFMGGVNDHTQNIQIGDLDSATNKNKDTYFGALNVLFEELKKKYSNKLIVSMTPMDYVASDSAPHIVEGKNTNGNTVADFRNAMKVACEHHGIYLLDLHSKVGFNANNVEDVKYFHEQDRLHPNQAGVDKMALVIAEELNKLA